MSQLTNEAVRGSKKPAALAVVGLMLAASAAVASPAQAAPAPKALKTFGTGDVTATGPKSATIVNETGEYGGVYVQAKSQTGKSLGNVDFQFTSTGDVGGGAPRFSVPIDDGDVDTNAYAFLDAVGCGGVSGATTLVSTDVPTCSVSLNVGGSWANWDAFAAANPTYRVARSTPFIISDVAGNYAVQDIVLR